MCRIDIEVMRCFMGLTLHGDFNSDLSFPNACHIQWAPGVFQCRKKIVQGHLQMLFLQVLVQLHVLMRLLQNLPAERLAKCTSIIQD